MYSNTSFFFLLATSFIEDTILHCCLLDGLNPSGTFLHTVYSLLLLLLSTRHRVVSVSGSTISGRRGVVKTCIEAMKMIGHSVTVSNVPIDAIGEEQLLGQQEQGYELILH